MKNCLKFKKKKYLFTTCNYFSYFCRHLSVQINGWIQKFYKTAGPLHRGWGLERNRILKTISCSFFMQETLVDRCLSPVGEKVQNLCKSRIGNKECSNLMQKCCQIDAKILACQIEYCQQKNKPYLKNNCSVKPIITAVTTIRKCKKI